MKSRKWDPAIVGLVGIAVSVGGADLWAVLSDRPTVSAGIAHALKDDPAASVTFGCLAGLFWHLVVGPIIHRLEQA